MFIDAARDNVCVSDREGEKMTDANAGRGRHGRPSARDARRAQRAVRPSGPAYITRAMPPYELLSPEGLEALERHADRLLAEVGLEIRGDAEAIRLWQRAGAIIEDEWRVHVPT